MAIRSIEQIKINGSKKAFGGYVYNAGLEINLNKEASRLSINVVSEDGNYSEPVLSATAPYKIDIGKTISQNFFAVSYRENRGSNGNTLEVTFLDGSIILDQISVGLHKRHGENPKAKSIFNLQNLPDHIQNPYPQNVSNTVGNAPNMIIVGEEIHPCDVNDDGVFDNKDLAEIIYDQQDVCNIRCNDESVDVNSLQVECVNKTKVEVFEVRYRFSELLDAMSKYVKVVQRPALTNDFYKGDYVGTLRQVLSEWCSLLGLTFFWENDGLNFVDVSKQPKIRIPQVDCVEQTVKSKTIEGTVSRGSISHYSQAGQILDRDCSTGQLISLHCLTLRDLYTEYWKPNYGDGKTGQPEDDPTPTPKPAEDEYKDTVYPNGVPIERLEEACVCAFYSQRLRDLYILRGYYGLKEAKDFVAAKNKTLDRYGSLKILRVFDKDNLDSVGGNQYDSLIGDKGVFASSELEQFKKNKGFFIIAQVNTQKLTDQFQQEENLATSFMGRNWIRAYRSPYYGTEPEVRPKGQYIGGGMTELKNATFANFNHTNDSRIATLGQTLQVKPRLAGGQTPLQATKEALKTIKSIIYYERPDAVWSPIRDTKNYLDTLLSKLKDTFPRMCKGVSPETIKNYLQKEVEEGSVDIGAIERREIVMMAMFPGEFVVTGDFANNPFEEHPAYVPIAQFPMAKVGLLSPRCVRYTIAGVTVDTPAGASCRFSNDYNSPLMDPRNTAYDATFNLSVPIYSGTPSYQVVVIQTQKPHVEIPKVEATFISPPPDTNALRVEYIMKSQIENQTIRALNNLKKECVPDMAILQKAHEQFNKGLTFSVTKPYESYEFTVAGIDLPEKASIANGLENLSIRIDEKGVFSTYTIGNSLFSPISEEILAKRLEFQLRMQNRPNGAFSNAVIPRKPNNQ